MNIYEFCERVTQGHRNQFMYELNRYRGGRP